MEKPLEITTVEPVSDLMTFLWLWEILDDPYLDEHNNLCGTLMLNIPPDSRLCYAKLKEE